MSRIILNGRGTKVKVVVPTRVELVSNDYQSFVITIILQDYKTVTPAGFEPIFH